LPSSFFTENSHTSSLKRDYKVEIDLRNCSVFSNKNVKKLAEMASFLALLPDDLGTYLIYSSN
jgi:hypothetical protein